MHQPTRKPGKRNLRKTVDLNHVARAVERFQRRNGAAAQAQTRVDRVLDHRHLIVRGDFQKSPALGHRQDGAGRIVKIGRDENEFHAVLHQHGFERIDVEADMARARRIGFDAHGERANARAGENCDRARIGGILERDRIARAQKRLADKVDRLLAAVGDQQLLVADVQAFAAKHFDQQPLERFVAVRRAKLQNAAAFVAQHGIATAAEFFDREEFTRRPRNRERDGAWRNIRHQAAQAIFAALVGKQRFPAQRTAVAIRARRRRELLHRRVANECAATHVPLDQPFGFEFGIGVRDRRAVHAELTGKLAARGYAIAGAKLARMNQSAQLVAAIARRAEYGFRVVNGAVALA